MLDSYFFINICRQVKLVTLFGKFDLHIGVCYSAIPIY